MSLYGEFIEQQIWRERIGAAREGLSLPTVLIAEDNFSGHRFDYVKTLTRGALAAGWDVAILTAPDADSHRLEQFHSIGARTDQATHHSLRCLAAAARRAKASLVLVPDGDRLALKLAFARWPGDAKLRVLIMRPQAQPRRFRWQTMAVTKLRRALFKFAGTRRRVELRYLASALQSDLPLPWVPDPIRFEPADEPPIDLAGDVAWVGVLGSIDERKNVPYVANAVAKAAPGSCGLLLAGELSNGVRQFMERDAPNIPQCILDRYLRDDELDALIAALSVVVVAYTNESPSGIIGKSAAAGTRVLAAGAQTLKADCCIMGPGAVWVPLTPQALETGLQRVLAQPRPAARQLDAAAFVERLVLVP